MKDEYYIDLRGKRYVLYKGLLAMAHEKGLKRVSTEERQFPTPENGDVAIMHAAVVLDGGTGDPKDDKVFMGIGDASAENVGRAIAPHIIRMAETRAKARAFRDAVGVGETSFEELEDDDSAPAPVTPLREAQQQAKPQYQPRGEEPKPASRKQLNYLEGLIKGAVEGGIPRFEEKIGKHLSELTSKEASGWIEKFSGKTG